MEPIVPKLLLIPTDFSAPSAQALRYGAALAERFSAHLLVIYADPFVLPVDLTLSAGAVFDMARIDMVDAAREQLEAFVETNVPRSVPYDIRVLVGTPVDAILAQASEVGAGLIVMGTHGRTGLHRLLVGSVAGAIMRLAPVPVIVVHDESPLESAAMRRIASAPQSTHEAAVAVSVAHRFGGDNAEYLEVPEGADLAEIARAGAADLIVLGIVARHGMADSLRGTAAERVVQHTICPALTVNRFAAARVAGVIHDFEPVLAG
ncbi:MAG TPA: universal stress protein [Thermoanaerobaculia bacterium]|nr:universal stress protein [Thermoanaerobaculia bacterium]